MNRLITPAPALALALALVACLSAPALAADVELVTGEVLHAEVLERSEAGVWIRHPVLGKLWVRADQLRSVDGGPLRAAAAPVTLDDTATAVATAETKSSDRWKYTVELGASGKSGNTDTSDLHSAITAIQEDAEGRWKAEAIYDYAESSKLKSKDKADLRATRDLKLDDSPWFAFFTGRIEWDEFQDWTRRYTVGAGAGRTLLEDDDLTVRMRVGLQGLKEIGVQDESWRTEGSVGLEAAWKINAEQSLAASTTYYPDLEESGERRIESAVSWSIKLNDADNLRLKLGVKNEYDSHRVRPFETNDFEYFAALLYEF